MKKRVRLIALLVLAIITAALLWKFVPWATLSAKYATFSISDLSPVWYYSSVILLAVLLMVVIWFVLQIIPKRQARAFYKPDSLIVLGEQKVSVEGFEAKAQSGVKPTELFTIENEARKTLSQIIGGFIVIVSLILTGANLAITSRLTQEGQITDRFTKAITQLGDKDKLEVRLGGIYALERIAKDSDKDHWTIMEVLTAYVRENAPRKEEKPAQKNASRKNQAKEETPIPKLPTDIQAILTVIGRRKADGESNTIDLGNTDLRGADLSGADLRHAILFNAKLSDAKLSHADLSYADLRGADLRGANLRGAYLSGAYLSGADLSGANLLQAILFNANLSDAKLSDADLSYADLRGAALFNAKLSESKFLTWEQVSTAIIDDETKLPPEIESQHKDELKVMRKKTRKERQGK